MDTHDEDEPQPPARPRLGATGQTEAAQRRARQAAALRENLRRRKVQERLRDASPDAARDGSEPARKGR